MKQVRTNVLLVGMVVLLFAFWVLSGCGQKKVETSQTPTVVGQTSSSGSPTAPQAPNSSPTPIAESKSNPSSKPPTEPTMHEAAPEPEPVIDSTPSKLMPILMGEDFNGIMAAMGREPDQTYPGIDSDSYIGWTYENYMPSHSICFLFSQKDKKVMSAMWTLSNESRYSDYYSNPTKPEIIIPKKIWDSDPEGIYRSDKNTIVVYWKYNGDCYLAHLADSKRQLVETITGINSDTGLKYQKDRMTAATQDFRACDNVLSFGYIKGYQRFFWDQPGYGVSGHFSVSYWRSMTFYPE